MSIPSLTVELSLANPGVTSPSWQDITDYVTSLSTKRGRVYELDQIQAGTCQMTLTNIDRRFDPSYTLGPYYGGLRPMNRIRVSAALPGNLCTNSDAVTGLTGWAGVQGTETVTRDTTFPKAGPAAVKTVTPGSVALEGPKWGTWVATAGQTYTVSVWARLASGSQNCRLRVTSPGAGLEATTTVAVTSTYQRFTLTFTSTVSDAHSLSLVTDTTAAVTLYTGSVMVENAASAGAIQIMTDGAAVAATTCYLFTGFVERWPPKFSRPDWNEVTITATDAFMALAQATVSGTFASKATGARIADVLASANWATSVAAAGYWTLGTSALGSTTRLSYPIPTTVLDTGNVTLPAITFAASSGQSPLAHIQDVVGNTERGVFFVDGQGRVVFHDRYHRLKLGTSSVTLSDSTAASTATSIRYTDIQPSMDADHVQNDISVTASGTGATAEVTDSTSVDTYFRRTLSVSAQLSTDAEALSLGRMLIRQLKDAMLRFDSVTLEPWSDDNQWPHALGREISDRVSVSLTPPSTPDVTAQAIAQDCHIEAIEHRVKPPLVWETTFQLSPRPAEFWVLGSSALGTATALAA